MANQAKVAITGRLTGDPRQSNVKGTTVVSFTVAVSTTKKEGDKYIADYYNVSVWGQNGEYIFPKLGKGLPVQVYGDLILQDYKDSAGNDRKSLSFRATDVITLAKKESTQPKEEAPLF